MTFLVPRAEVDAKLAAAEVGTETRFVELNAKLNALILAVAELKTDNKFTRWMIGVTVMASFFAFISALWVTQSNLLAAFQAGIALKNGH